jgi:hypothetical protein
MLLTLLKFTTKHPQNRDAKRRFIPVALLMFVVLYAFTTTPRVAIISAHPFAGSLVTDTLPKDSLPEDSSGIAISKDAPKSKITYSATDSCFFDIRNRKLYLVTDAVMEYENVKVEAGYIMVDWNTNRLYAYGFKDSMADSTVGRPVLTIDNEPYASDTMIYDFKTKKGRMKSVRTKQGEGYLSGETVKRNSDETIFLKHGWYTTCNAEHPHFQIDVTKAKLIPNKQIVTGPAFLVIADVPMPVAVPFGFFPINKGQRNGFVIPRFANEESPNGRGFGLLDGGYYFHIKQYADMRLTGSIFSKGSWIVSASSNYVKRYRFNGGIRFDYANNKRGEPNTSEQTISKQFFLQWTHNLNQLVRPGTNFSANVNLSSGGVSGNYLRRNSTNTNEFLNNEIRSNISFSKSFLKNRMSLTLNANHSQNSVTHLVNMTLPSGQFYINNIYPFRFGEHVGSLRWYEKITTNYNMQFLNTLASNDSTFYTAAQYRTDTLKKYLKNGFMHTIPLGTSFNILKYLTISPGLQFNQRFYFNTVNKTLAVKGNYNGTGDSIYTQTVNGFKAPVDYSINLGMSTRFFGKFSFYRTKLIAIRHTVTPSVGFSYRPDYSEDRYGYYRKIGVVNDTTRTRYNYYSIFEGGVFQYPSLGKTAALSFSLGNNFESKWKSKKDTVTGTKKVMLLDFLNINSGYNFLADSLKLGLINFSLGTNILRRISVNVSGSFNPYQVDSNAGMEYNIDKLLIRSEEPILARLQYIQAGLVFSLNSDVLKKKKSSVGTAEELNDVNDHPMRYIDFTIPWNLNFNYNFRYNAPYRLLSNEGFVKYTQSLMLSGDLRITANWKVAGNMAIDPTTLRLQYVSMDLYRDLHCWDMRLNVIPFGERRGFYFALAAKSSLLQDLKLTRRFDARYY